MAFPLAVIFSALQQVRRFPSKGQSPRNRNVTSLHFFESAWNRTESVWLGCPDRVPSKAPQPGSLSQRTGSPGSPAQKSGLPLHRSGAEDGLALPRRNLFEWGIFGMSEPIIACPHCKAEIGLTEALTAPLIQATHKKIAEREREVARR